METYPEITFASTAVEQTDDDDYPVTGDLTIKGVTKPVTVDFDTPGPPSTRMATADRARGQGDRQPQGLGRHWNAALEAGGVLVSEKVTLEFEVSAIRTGTPETDQTKPRENGMPEHCWTSPERSSPSPAGRPASGEPCRWPSPARVKPSSSATSFPSLTVP